jgi:hypothetical protein
MRRRIPILLILSFLVACGTPTTNLDQGTPEPGIGDAATDEIVTAETIPFEPPAALTSGSFSPLMTTSLNQTLFPDSDAEEFSVIGMIESDGLIYVYLAGKMEIYYAVSSNGVDWALSPEPIFSGLISDDFEFFPTAVNFTANGYAIYLGSATVNYADHNYLYSIWTLSAPTPTGPWVLGENPVLYGYPGPGGHALYIARPIVRPYLDGFRMYYTLAFEIEDIMTPDISVAHSWDGSSWRFTFDLPTEDTLDRVVPLELSDSVDWEGRLILDVWPTKSGWQMLTYRPESDGSWSQMTLVESEDGIRWNPSEVDIDIDPPMDSGNQSLASASMIYYDDHYLLIYCIIDSGSHDYQCFVMSTR